MRRYGVKQSACIAAIHGSLLHDVVGVFLEKKNLILRSSVNLNDNF